MRNGYFLFVDEAGDEGIEKVRPLDPDGSPEYFVLGGVLVSIPGYNLMKQDLNAIRMKLGLSPGQNLHFKDLSDADQIELTTSIANMCIGAVAIVSNKRNMRGYRNRRCEKTSYEVVKGRVKPKKNNWFYNNLLRYMLERATEECGRRTFKTFGQKMPIKVVMSARKGFSYSQTKAYLRMLSVRGHDKTYFNNRHWIDWSMLNISDLEDRRPKNEPGLQIADCIASAIFRSIDQSWFGDVRPQLIENISRKFIKKAGSPKDHGFKLLPDGFSGPLSESQKRSFRATGYLN